MNQQELNKVAWMYLYKHWMGVGEKLQGALISDAEERSKQVPSWQALRHIHNMGLFECVAWLNFMAFHSKDTSEELPKKSLEQYERFVETLRPKFLDIVEALQDFQLDASGEDPDAMLSVSKE